MEFAQLACFVAVLEERSFTRGAQRLHVVQSAASSAVSRLERELGMSLLTRTTRSVAPTDAGLAVYRRALQILATVQDIHDELAAFRAGERGTAVLGVVLSTGTIDLAGVLSGLQHSHPGLVVHLRFIPGSADTRHEPLLDGTVDLAVVPMPSTVIADVSVRPIARATMSLVCRRDNPLSGARNVRLIDLEYQHFIDFPTGWGNRVIIDSLFASHQANRSVVVEVTEVTTALTMIRSSLGIAFLPSDVALPDELTVVDLAESPPSITLGLASATHRPMSAAVSILARAIVAHDHPHERRPG